MESQICERFTLALSGVLGDYSLLAVFLWDITFYLKKSQSFSRLSSISIFDGQPLVWALLEFGRNYFYHISPDFLFLHGDQNLRHNPLGVGQEHWLLFPLVLFGILRAFRRREWIDQILLAWLFCFPIAASCTPRECASCAAQCVCLAFAATGGSVWHSGISGLFRVVEKPVFHRFSFHGMLCVVLFLYAFFRDFWFLICLPGIRSIRQLTGNMDTGTLSDGGKRTNSKVI